MAKAKKTKPRKKKPKGKKLSAALEERAAKRAAEEAAAREAALARAAELDAEDAEDGADDELKSEPPPSYSGEEGDDDDGGPEHPEPYEADARDQDDAEDDDDGDDGDDDGDDGDEEDQEDGDEALSDDDDEYEDEDDEELAAAAQMGHQRYVIAGFFGLWMIVAYIAGQALQMAWSNVAARDWFVERVPQLAAIPHEGELVSRASVSLILGGVLAGLVVLRYYFRPDIRQWADEVAEELYQVKWPDRKEVGNNTVVVIAASAAITLFLSLLDRFWSFVTNLIYSSGAG